MPPKKYKGKKQKIFSLKEINKKKGLGVGGRNWQILMIGKEDQAYG